MKALEDSIKHWERLASGKRRPGERHMCSSCALCKKFLSPLDCGNCPVKKRTGEDGCKGSPWDECDRAHAATLGDYNSPQFKTAAKKMLKFLRSLRKDVK